MKITLRYSIQVDAPREAVWDVLINDAKSQQWLKALSPNSRAEGTWSKGSFVKYIDDNVGGTKAVIEDFEVNTRILVRYVAVIGECGQEVEGEMTEKWIDTTEEYKLTSAGSKERDVTLLNIAVITHPDFEKMFDEFWPVALSEIKKMAGPNI